MTPLTQEEIEAAGKGYHKAFTDYLEGDPGERFVLRDAERQKIETWCKPFLDAGIEIGGAFVFHVEESALIVDHVYCNGGNSKFRRTTVIGDSDHLLKLIQGDSPDITGFITDRVGFWHLHPGYFDEPILSVGDVKEIRGSLEESGATTEMEIASAQMLVYGNPDNSQFSIGAFYVRLDRVYRFPVSQK